MNRIQAGPHAREIAERGTPPARAANVSLAIASGLALLANPAAGAPRFHAALSTDPAIVAAGQPVELSFTVCDSLGSKVRFLQFVHERPLHLIVVSRDLSEFAHIHPELGVGDNYSVTHTFTRAGSYRLFADYTPPGSGTIVDRFDVDVAGVAPKPAPLLPDAQLVHTVDGVRVALRFDHPPRANEDVLLTTSLSDSSGTTPITNLQLYLGALAHFILVSEDLSDFIHAHPLETGEVYDPTQNPAQAHIHDPALLAKSLVGPSPSTIRAATSFPRAGRYKLWMQFQRAKEVVTVPFVFTVGAAARVAAGRVAAQPVASPPADAIRIVVSAAGYTPARVDLKKGVPATLVFSRPNAGNCGGTVVIPGLRLRRDLPVGETVTIRFTPNETAEIPFTCGMGMMQGLIVVK